MVGVWGVRICLQSTWTSGGLVDCWEDYLGWGVGSQKRIVCFKGFINSLSFNLIKGQMMSLYHL